MVANVKHTAVSYLIFMQYLLQQCHLSLRSRYITLNLLVIYIYISQISQFCTIAVLINLYTNTIITWPYCHNCTSKNLHSSSYANSPLYNYYTNCTSQKNWNQILLRVFAPLGHNLLDDLSRDNTHFLPPWWLKESRNVAPFYYHRFLINLFLFYSFSWLTAILISANFWIN